MALSGSGRGIMKLDDSGYIGVPRNELTTPGRSGRSARASVRFVDMEDLKNRLRQELNEKVGALEEQLRKMQQDYPQSAGGSQAMQQHGEHASASELAELTMQLDEVKRVKNELQQQLAQQERQMERTKAQQMSEMARRIEQQQREMAQIREQQECELAQNRKRQEREMT